MSPPSRSTRAASSTPRGALHDASFKERVTKHELDGFEANIAKLEAGAGARSPSLHAQIAAGVHTASGHAALIAFFADVRDDAKLAFPTDKAMQHAFGVGVSPSPASTGEVRHEAESLLASAAAHTSEAKHVGLDGHGVHHLEDLVHAIDGADLAHVHAVTNRHTTRPRPTRRRTSSPSRPRTSASWPGAFYRGHDDKLAPFAATLPRKAITPRKPPPAATPAPTTGA